MLLVILILLVFYLNFTIETFQVFNNNIKFPYNDLFKKNVTDYLKKQFGKNDDKLYLFGNLFDIEFKETDTTIIYKFKSFISTPKSNTNTVLIELTVEKSDNSITINSVKYLTDIKETEFLPGYTYEFYTIKNKYYLMDPFLTTSKELVITDDMKTKFAKVLNEKYQTILKTDFMNYKL